MNLPYYMPIFDRVNWYNYKLTKKVYPGPTIIGTMKLELPALPFDMNALEPYISKMTLECHYGKHYLAYITNLNKLLTGTKYKNLDIETIIRLTDGPVFNNAAQVWNHSFYFECLRPGSNNLLKGRFADVIRHNFGTISFFKNSFIRSAESIFGVGWVWLIFNPARSLEIIQKGDAGNPLRAGLFPLLNCDLWEHAYYLDYQDRRRDYVEAFWKLINWELIEERYNDILQLRINNNRYIV
jgi:superoxide dismutase, Fe-Mn family